MKTKTPEHVTGIRFLRFVVALIFDFGWLALYFHFDPKSYDAVVTGFQYLWSVLWEHIK